jgi:valyl-tRNA synthetase
VIQAPDGRRMSKSLGTGIDPLGEIEQHGADGVRFGLLAMSSSQDVRYSAEKVQQGQQLVYDFIYGDLCDWYLELVKPRLYEADGGEKDDLASTLLYVLTETLQTAHPVIPFVTEEIFSHVPGAEGLLAARLAGEPGEADEAAEQAVTTAIEAVQALRGWRDSIGAPAGARIPARIEASGYDETAAQVARLARLDLDAAADGEAVAQVTIPGGVVNVYASDAVDLGAAERKLAERRKTLEAEVKRARGKLANEGFVAKAPAAVVDAERQKLAALEAELEAL